MMQKVGFVNVSPVHVGKQQQKNSAVFWGSFKLQVARAKKK